MFTEQSDRCHPASRITLLALQPPSYRSICTRVTWPTRRTAPARHRAAREIVAPINAFHRRARALGVPIVHVRSVLRKSGADDIKGIPSAWRATFPLHVGPIPGADAHAIEGSRWTNFVTEVVDGDEVVETKKRLSAFLSNRSRLPAAQHARLDPRPRRRLHRLLRTQYGVRRQQSYISCDRRSRSGPRHERGDGRCRHSR